MSKTKQKTLMIAISIASLSILCAAALLPGLAKPSNCGGNTGALNACKSVALCFQIISSERRDKTVSIDGLANSEREYFNQIAGMNWIGEAKILVISSLVTVDENPRQIISVCDKPFNNVPRKTFGKAPLTHAVGYSDGSTDLISVEDFQKLNLEKFVDVKKLAKQKITQASFLVH